MQHNQHILQYKPFCGEIIKDDELIHFNAGFISAHGTFMLIALIRYYKKWK